MTSYRNCRTWYILWPYVRQKTCKRSHRESTLWLVDIKTPQAVVVRLTPTYCELWSCKLEHRGISTKKSIEKSTLQSANIFFRKGLYKTLVYLLIPIEVNQTAVQCWGSFYSSAKKWLQKLRPIEAAQTSASIVCCECLQCFRHASIEPIDPKWSKWKPCQKEVDAIYSSVKIDQKYFTAPNCHQSMAWVEYFKGNHQMINLNDTHTRILSSRKCPSAASRSPFCSFTWPQVT